VCLQTSALAALEQCRECSRFTAREVKRTEGTQSCQGVRAYIAGRVVTAGILVLLWITTTAETDVGTDELVSWLLPAVRLSQVCGV